MAALIAELAQWFFYLGVGSYFLYKLWRTVIRDVAKHQVVVALGSAHSPAAVPLPVPTVPAPGTGADEEAGGSRATLIATLLVAFISVVVFWRGPLEFAPLPELHVWVPAPAPLHPARYQWNQFGKDERYARVPVIECAYYREAQRLIDLVLPPIPEITADERREPESQLHAEQARATMQHARDVALKRCIVDEVQMVPLNTNMSHLLARPHIWDWLPPRPAFANISAYGLVDTVVITRDARRYYPVLAVLPRRPDLGVPAGSMAAPLVYELQPALLDEQALFATLAQWMQEYTRAAQVDARNENCFCLAHFGIVNSGMRVSYDTSALNNAVRLKNIGTSPWHLHAAMNYVRPLAVDATGQANEVESRPFYQPHYMRFPAEVDAALGVGYVSRPEQGYTTFLDLANVLDSHIGSVYIDAQEAHWIDEAYTNTPPAETTPSPTAAVFALTTLVPPAGWRNREVLLASYDMGCFAYCYSVDAKVAQVGKKST